MNKTLYILIIIIIIILIRLYYEKTHIIYFINSFINNNNIVGVSVPKNILDNIIIYIVSLKLIDQVPTELSHNYTFIDFGCGLGNVIKGVYNIVDKVEGIELDDNLATIAKNKFSMYKNVKIYNMNMIDYKFNDVNTILYLYEPLWLMKDKTQVRNIYTTVFNNLISQVKNSKIIIIYCDSVFNKLLDINFFKQYNLTLINKIKYPRFIPFSYNNLYIITK